MLKRFTNIYKIWIQKKNDLYNETEITLKGRINGSKFANTLQELLQTSIFYEMLKSRFLKFPFYRFRYNTTGKHLSKPHKVWD